MLRKPAQIRFAADRGHRAQLIVLALFMVLVVFGSTRADEDFFRVAPPAIALAWLMIALSRNRTVYDADRKTLVSIRGIWPRLKRREFASHDLLELKLDGNSKDIVSKTTLSATTDPDGEIVVFDKRAGVGSADLLADIDFVCAEMNLSLYIDESFEEVLEKSQSARLIRKYVLPVLQFTWGLVCVGAAASLAYLTLVREGYDLPRYLHILKLYDEPDKGLSTGMKYEITLAMVIASGVWLAFKALREGPRTIHSTGVAQEEAEHSAHEPVLDVVHLR